MANKTPLLLHQEGKRRMRILLKNRFKASNPKTKNGKEVDRTIGMPNGAFFKSLVKDKENRLDANTLRQRCLEITKVHN